MVSNGGLGVQRACAGRKGGASRIGKLSYCLFICEEIGMPFYKVWYQNKPEPLEFSTAGRIREEEIVERVLAHEQRIAYASPEVDHGDAATVRPTVLEIISSNDLTPVRYTEDESEPFTIG
jgi:hypothetical protein